MSADGEIDIAVRAEGADDAAEELSQGVESEGGGGNPRTGGGGGDGLTTAIKGGIVGGFIAQGTKPLLDVLDPILKILQAFLAPVALMLMRLLNPVLRQLIQLLPAWFDFMARVDKFINNAVRNIEELPGRIWALTKALAVLTWRAFKNGAGWLAKGAANIGLETWFAFKSWADGIRSDVASIPFMIWAFIKSGAAWITNGASEIATQTWEAFKGGVNWLTDDLPADISGELQGLGVEILEWVGNPFESIGGGDDGGGGSPFGPIVPPVGPLVSSAATTTGGNLRDLFEQAAGGGQNVAINLSGGLGAFVENVERDPNVNL